MILATLLFFADRKMMWGGVDVGVAWEGWRGGGMGGGGVGV